MPGLAQFRSAGGSFCLVAGTPTEHLHMAFAADDDATVEGFHRAATQAGHRDDGAERPAQRTPTRSTTNTSVSSGPMTPPAPRLP